MSANSGMSLGDILADMIARKNNRALNLAHNQRANNRALYIAMCKGKVAQRSIHPGKNRPVIGQGFAYHGHINIEKE